MMLTIKDFLSAQEVKQARDSLTRLPFVEGNKTGKKVLKNNLQADKNNPEVQKLTNAVISRMMGRREFTSFTIPKNVTLMFNRYEPGMEYKDHMDAALMGASPKEALRADASFTVFLTDPWEYEGGEFVLQTPFGEQRIKHPAGTLICYPTTMIHRVDAVTSGARWSAVGWVQSFAKDPQQRALLRQMDDFRYQLAKTLGSDSPLPEEFAHIHQNLLRMWIEV